MTVRFPHHTLAELQSRAASEPNTAFRGYIELEIAVREATPFRWPSKTASYWESES